MSLAQKGRTFSAATIEKMRASKIGTIMSPETIAKIVAKNTGKKRSEEFRKNRMGPLNSNFGRKHTEEELQKMSAAQKNRIHAPEIGAKISAALKGKLVGEKNPMWKGGVTSINKKIRTSVEYKLWRKSVFERDNFTCVWCLRRGVKIHADHIKPFAYYPELRFAIDNGRTLCVECHKKTDTYGGRGNKRTI